MLSLLFQLSYITHKKHCKLLPAMPFVTLYFVTLYLVWRTFIFPLKFGGKEKSM